MTLLPGVGPHGSYCINQSQDGALQRGAKTVEGLFSNCGLEILVKKSYPIYKCECDYKPLLSLGAPLNNTTTRYQTIRNCNFPWLLISYSRVREKSNEGCLVKWEISAFMSSRKRFQCQRNGRRILLILDSSNMKACSRPFSQFLVMSLVEIYFTH